MLGVGFTTASTALNLSAQVLYAYHCYMGVYEVWNRKSLDSNASIKLLRDLTPLDQNAILHTCILLNAVSACPK